MERGKGMAGILGEDRVEEYMYLKNYMCCKNIILYLRNLKRYHCSHNINYKMHSSGKFS